MGNCTLYVDIENLPEIDKQVLIATIARWPADFAKPDVLKLYVRADQTELWKIWVSHNIPSVEAHIQGVQHYCFTGSKNSADITLSLDVLADLIKGRTKYAALLSDDSDYVCLFAAIKREIGKDTDGKIPFKWLMTDRTDTRSQILSDFFPPEYVHTVTRSGPVTNNAPKEKDIRKDIKIEPLTVNSISEEDRIARAIINNIPTGPFRSADCKKVILKYFPENKMGSEDSAKFGTHFSKHIWPILGKYGVLLPNPSRKPRKYEMTDEAKRKVG